MKTIGIRIEVAQDLYSKLQIEQIKQKNETGTKPSLASIIIKLCILGLKYLYEMGKNNVNVQPPKPKETSSDPATTAAIAARERELIAKEKQLKTWEANLRAREFELIEKNKTNIETSETLMKQRNNIYDEKEAMLEKSQETLKLQIQKENLEKVLYEKDEQLILIKVEFEYLKKNISKTLSNIERQTIPDQFAKYGMPIINLIALVIHGVITNKKIDSINNLSPLEKEIFSAFNSLSPEEQEIVKNLIDEIINKGKSQ